MDLICVDCHKPTTRMKPKTVALGGPNREPGEVLCGGCSSRRTIMVRQLDALPSRLTDIRSKRMVR